MQHPRPELGSSVHKYAIPHARASSFHMPLLFHNSLRSDINSARANRLTFDVWLVALMDSSGYCIKSSYNVAATEATVFFQKYFFTKATLYPQLPDNDKRKRTDGWIFELQPPHGVSSAYIRTSYFTTNLKKKLHRIEFPFNVPLSHWSV